MPTQLDKAQLDKTQLDKTGWAKAGTVPPPTGLLSDEPPLETDLHLRQILLLISCLDWLWQDRQDFYCAGNLTIYYSPHQRKSEDFRGPDFFVVLGTERRPRNSWTVWEEGGRYPNIIIELLSTSTAATDRGLKKQIYQDIFCTPEYFWFDPASLEFQGFQLISGHYQPLTANPQGWLWSQQLQLFLGIHEQQLRFFTADGAMVATPHEAAQVAEARAALAEEQAALAEEQAALAEEQAALAEEQVALAEALLERYRQQFGELPGN
jgi:Uma2 family endonuclease